MAAFSPHDTADQEIAVYPFSGHEGGGTPHFLAQLAFLARMAQGIQAG